MANIMQMGDEPKYLGSWDLYEQPNQKIQVTIKEIKEEFVEGSKGTKEKKAVCYFTENFKPMILNIENKKRLARLFGTRESSAFIGKRIEIGYEKVKAFGDIHDALRITPRKISQTAAYNAPKCEACKKDIQPRGNMDAASMAKYTAQKYGKALCAACATQLAAQMKAAENAEQPQEEANADE